MSASSEFGFVSAAKAGGWDGAKTGGGAWECRSPPLITAEVHGSHCRVTLVYLLANRFDTDVRTVGRFRVEACVGGILGAAE